MSLTYDSGTDALTIRLRGGRVHHTEDMDDGLVVEIDDDGRVMGFQLADARKRLTLEELTSVTYENAATNRRASLTLP